MPYDIAVDMAEGREPASRIAPQSIRSGGVQNWNFQKSATVGDMPGLKMLRW